MQSLFGQCPNAFVSNFVGASLTTVCSSEQTRMFFAQCLLMMATGSLCIKSANPTTIQNKAVTTFEQSTTICGSYLSASSCGWKTHLYCCPARLHSALLTLAHLPKPMSQEHHQQHRHPPLPLGRQRNYFVPIEDFQVWAKILRFPFFRILLATGQNHLPRQSLCISKKSSLWWNFMVHHHHHPIHRGHHHYRIWRQLLNSRTAGLEVASCQERKSLGWKEKRWTTLKKPQKTGNEIQRDPRWEGVEENGREGILTRPDCKISTLLPLHSPRLFVQASYKQGILGRKRQIYPVPSEHSRGQCIFDADHGRQHCIWHKIPANLTDTTFMFINISISFVYNPTSSSICWHVYKVTCIII